MKSVSKFYFSALYIRRHTLLIPVFLILISSVLLAYSSQEKDFFHIDLTDVVNRGFTDETAGDGKGGWADFGREASFWNIPVGRHVFNDGIVPFHIINPLKNNGKSALVLDGPGREEVFPDISRKIKIGRKLSCLFFLHTCMYVKHGALELVHYKIHYADGTEQHFTCHNNQEIADWWEPSEFLPQSLRVYEESHKWLILTPWKNQYPDKKIEWIQMESTGNAIPVLIAITGSENLQPYKQLSGIIRKRIEDYKNSELKIAMLQIRSSPDQAWNLEKGDAFCKKAKKQGADIALFPEMYNIGYNSVDFNKPDAEEKWKNLAIKQDSEFVRHFQNLAKKLDMAIVITYLEDIGGNKYPRNSASLIDRHGKIVLTYAKVHTLDFFSFENMMTPGDDFYVAELDTKAGIINVGMMICYDREFPESARILMLKGAEIILTPNACNLGDLRLGQFRSRAFENAVVTVMTNYGKKGENTRFNGHSCIYDANGDEVRIAEEEEGVYIGSVNIHDLRTYRKETVWGNAYRRPHKYDIITNPEVDDVFKRKNSFGKDFKRLKR
jgi:predicted amidohydrolase